MFLRNELWDSIRRFPAVSGAQGTWRPTKRQGHVRVGLEIGCMTYFVRQRVGLQERGSRSLSSPFWGRRAHSQVADTSRLSKDCNCPQMLVLIDRDSALTLSGNSLFPRWLS
jgi:hypothetical protein